MVTGIKIASGAKIKIISKKGWDGKVSAGVHVVPANVNIGPDAKWKQSDEDTESSTRDVPFVFAFRLTEIYYDRGKEMNTRILQGGQLYNEDRGRNVEEDEGMKADEEGFHVTGLADKDPNPKTELKLDSEVVVDDDDDEECRCIFV
jgi:hypothetical protein